MAITVVQYKDELEDVWDNFIDNNNRNATFIHSRKFLNHNPANKKNDSSLLFYKDSKLIGVLPAAIYKKDKKILFHSHPGSTYSGFVTHESVGVKEAMEIVEITIDFAKNKKVNEIIIRNPFRFFHSIPSDETDYAMWAKGFNIKFRELECAILLDDKCFDRYEPGTRRSVNKAEKHVTVGISEKYKEYWKMLTINLMEKHGVKPVHTLPEFMKLRTLVGNDKVVLITAEVEKKIIAGIALFVNKTAVRAQYIASDNNFQDLRPMNAVIDFIIRWAKENDKKYFNLGMANENEGKSINYGLFRFKEGFGGRGVLRETMSLGL